MTAKPLPYPHRIAAAFKLLLLRILLTNPANPDTMKPQTIITVYLEDDIAYELERPLAIIRRKLTTQPPHHHARPDTRPITRRASRV